MSERSYHGATSRSCDLYQMRTEGQTQVLPAGIGVRHVYPEHGFLRWIAFGNILCVNRDWDFG